MPANLKRSKHNRQDLIAVGQNMTRFALTDLQQIIDRVIESVSQWDSLSKKYEVPENLRKEISNNLPLNDFR